MKSPAERPSGSSPRTLPEGWRWVKLGDACRQDRQIVEPSTGEADSLTYYSLEHIESETGRILKAPIEQVEDEGKSTTFRFDKRHVLYGKLRPYLNKVALPDAAGRCTTEMIPLLPGDGIDRVFLAWILRRGETVEFAMHGKTGSRMPRADMSNLLTLELSLPPLPEQQRIAAILREQMAAVEKARAAAQARLEAVKALPVAFLRRVFPQPGEHLPDGWRWVKLDEVLEIADSGIWGDPDPADGLSILRSTNFRNDGSLDFSDLSLRAIPVQERKRKLLVAGDILLERSGGGPKQPVGRVCLFEGDTRDHSFGNFCQRLRARSDICDARFLFWHLHLFHSSGQTQFYQQQTTGIRNLEYRRYLVHELPLPPLPKQQRLVEVLREQMAAVEKARAAAEAELNTINALPAALLRRAFNGEI